MKTFGFTAIIASGLAAGILGFAAPAQATPTGTSSAVTGAFRVVDEDVSRAIVVDEREFTQQEVLALIDRAIRDATNGRLGGPVAP